jgi:hypothetical protein
MKKNSQILLRIPDRTRTRLHAHARAAGLSLSEMIRALAERELAEGELTRKLGRKTGPELLRSGPAEAIADLLVPEGGDMWAARARMMTLAILEALCDLRDRGELTLTPELIREHMRLGGEENGPGLGLIPLYRRARRGDLSEGAARALRGFLETLPGFRTDHMEAGLPQPEMTVRQTGYLTMQVTRPLGALIEAD